MRIIPEWKDYDAEIKTLLDGRSKEHTVEVMKSEQEATDEHAEL